MQIGTGLGLTLWRKRMTATAPEVLAVLAQYGANAHMWIPGVGVINGITVANFQDPAGTVAAVVDSPVGRANDVGGGSINVTAAPDANRPALRLSGGYHSWEFNGTNHRLALGSVPFVLTDDFCIVAGVSLTTSGTERAIFSQSNGSNNALPELMFNASGQLGVYVQGGGTIVNKFAGANNAGVGPIVASLVCRSNSMHVRRNSVEINTAALSGTYNTPTTAMLGAFATLTPGEFFPGNLYPVVVIKGTVSDANLAIIEDFVSRNP